MMNQPQLPDSWTDADFETMSWHDDTVHGIRIHNPSLPGASGECDLDLVLDLEHRIHGIATRKWIPELGKEIIFYQSAVAPAQLVFRGVDDLRLEFDLAYKRDLAIDFIDREEIAADGQRKGVYRWTVALRSTSGDAGRITFESRGFIQTLVGPLMGRYGLAPESES